MLFLITNLLIFTSHYILITKSGIRRVSEKIVITVLMGTAQIVISEIILGIFGNLSLGVLVILNLIISFVLISFVLYKFNSDIIKALRRDLDGLIDSINTFNTPYIFVLGILLIMVSLWIVLSSFLLPPRGFDDLSYHLPVIFEFILQEKIFLLPMDYRVQVAYPMNAELLFLWPVIFFKNDFSIGLVQYFYSLYGMLVIYVLSRLLDIKKATSLFLGMVFFFTPVVLAQAGVAYIDVITAVFFLVSLYLVVKYYLTDKVLYLYLCAVGSGLIMGMKYTMVVPDFVLSIILIPGFIKRFNKDIVIYIFIIILFSGYWYIRNYIELGNPIFPFGSFSGELRNYWDLDVVAFINGVLERIKLLFTKDSGLGSFHGGYGIVFWGLAFPSWLYLFVKSLRFKDKTGKARLFIMFQVITGFIILLLVPVNEFYIYPRFSIFIVGIGLVALGIIIDEFHEIKVYKYIIISFCCIFSFLSTFQMARAKIPSYQVNLPIYDIIRGREFSRKRYMRLSSTSLAFLWETLDYITLYHSRGLDVYFADQSGGYIGPAYGTYLQNRAWNFHSEDRDRPDACLFLIYDKSKVKYYGKKITLDEVVNDPEYEMVDKAEKAYFFLRKSIIHNDSEISYRLTKHYENYYVHEIRTISNNLDFLIKDIPIVTSDYLGFGFNYLNYINVIDNSVFMIPEGKELNVINNKGLKKFYTINLRLGKYNPVEVKTFKFDGKENIVYLNSNG